MNTVLHRVLSKIITALLGMAATIPSVKRANGGA
jgi:hypothetical protein